MRIALITSTFLPNFIGGREKHIYGLAKALVKLGHHDVYIVTGDRVKEVVKEEFEGVTVYRVPYIKEFKLRGIGESIPYRIVAPSFFSVLHHIEPEIIHAHDIKHFTSDAAAIYSYFLHKPFVLTVHGFFYRPSRLTKVLLRLHDLTLNLFTLKVARKIIVVSKRNVKWPLTLFRSKIVYIPNAVESSNHKGYSKSFKAKYRVPIDYHLVVSVGRLTFQKGFDILIRAWKIMRKREPDLRAKLVIIGPTQDQHYFKYLLKLAGDDDSIIFTGRVPDEDLIAALQDATVVVMPSRDEGMPTVLLEAISFGKPVVATSVGAIPDIIVNGVSSLLVKPESPEELAEALIKVLVDDKLRNEIARNAVKLRSYISWDNMVKHIVRIYEEVSRR